MVLMNNFDQINIWRSDFGKKYTERNYYDLIENSYIKKFGINKKKINSDFIHFFKKNFSFLEIGCNIGNQLRLLQSVGFDNLTGIDVQEDAIRIAIENNNNIKFIQGNAEQLPFQDNSIDVIITNNLLIHLDKENLLKTVSEICRVTKNILVF